MLLHKVKKFSANDLDVFKAIKRYGSETVKESLKNSHLTYLIYNRTTTSIIPMLIIIAKNPNKSL